MKKFSPKYVFKAVAATALFTDDEMNLFFCHTDDRYDRETLLQILEEIHDDGEHCSDCELYLFKITEKQRANLKKKIGLIPKDVIVLDDREWN